MTSNRELGNRLARVVDRISLGEFKLVKFNVSPISGAAPGMIEVKMILNRSPNFDENGQLKRSKLKRPTKQVRYLIFDEDE